IDIPIARTAVSLARDCPNDSDPIEKTRTVAVYKISRCWKTVISLRFDEGVIDECIRSLCSFRIVWIIAGNGAAVDPAEERAGLRISNCRLGQDQSDGAVSLEVARKIGYAPL